ncbi:hypothetical protein X566_08665 [Afipia sp. P52-10]|jgi:hypothetical protein|uniref:acyl-CoA thioesterase domain-containing protein n=1 Tax=Afipia sp. P52-10 TaxID=1429916 RepID=UPI0003DF1415|nr:acyl-CoA thioesterase domain-containing protein [Afipia sp. P52-10]ETR77706.1 hypothetical protein X566_08665 [Afipia sp. P52-10]
MSNEPFFTADGDRFIPTSAGRSPWDPKSMHGRIVIGLLGQEIERRHGSAAYMPTRLTVDMYRLPDFSPVEVQTRVVRDGKRIKVIDAEFFSNGISMARATSQLLLKTENPPGQVWTPPPWQAPLPKDIPPPTDPRTGMNGMWSVRPIEGAMGTLGPRKLWMSDIREVVGGVPLSPFTRVALSADFASPFANAGDQGLRYINSDVTVYMHRMPVTEWIGYEVIDHGATDGVAIAECRIHDEKGAIGNASVTALAQRMTTTQSTSAAKTPAMAK